MFRNRAVSLAMMSLVLWATGCIPIDVDQISDHERIRVLQVHRNDFACTTCGESTRDSVWTTIDNPRVSGDYIMGNARGNPIAIPISDADAIETEPGAAWTVLWGVLSLGAIVAFVALDLHELSDSPPGF